MKKKARGKKGVKFGQALPYALTLPVDKATLVHDGFRVEITGPETIAEKGHSDEVP